MSKTELLPTLDKAIAAEVRRRGIDEELDSGVKASVTVFTATRLMER